MFSSSAVLSTYSFLSLLLFSPLEPHSAQAPGGVRAAGEDLVPEPSNEVEEAGERGRAGQDGGRPQPPLRQRAWQGGGGLHHQGRLSQRPEQGLLHTQRSERHNDRASAQEQDFLNDTNNGACHRPSPEPDRK